MSTVLLVRSRQELTDEHIQQLKDHFGEDIEFVDVEPKTPEELRDLRRKYSAVAVILRENPLPKLVIEEGIPCIPLRPGPLQRLVSVETITIPL